MKIGLINIDSKIPNLALMKISAYHKAKGDIGFKINKNRLNLMPFGAGGKNAKSKSNRFTVDSNLYRQEIRFS